MLIRRIVLRHRHLGFVDELMPVREAAASFRRLRFAITAVVTLTSRVRMGSLADLEAIVLTARYGAAGLHGRLHPPTMTERNPYAPPQAEVRDAPAAPPTKGTLATRTLRLVGAILDSVASAMFVVPILVFTSYWTAAISGELSYVTVSLGGFAVFTAMQGYLLTTRGQTIGKWLVGTRIVRADNDEVPTLARTLGLRYSALAVGPTATFSVLVLNPVISYAFIVVALIDIALIFRRDRRCLHDLIARTKVVAVTRS
jgi:uncharacterized RDD family membrane protein YckC